MIKKDDGQFSKKEAEQRFEAALKAGLRTPPKPLKDKPKTSKAKATRKAKPSQ